MKLVSIISVKGTVNSPSLIFLAVENIGGGSPLRGYDVLAPQ